MMQTSNHNAVEDWICSRQYADGWSVDSLFGLSMKTCQITVRPSVIVTMAVVLIGLFGVVVVQALRRDEPVYLKKTLTAWLEEYMEDGHPLPSDEDSTSRVTPAQSAVRHIGTNAIPHLLGLIRAKDSMPKRFLTILERRQSLVQPRLLFDKEKRALGAAGFEILGSLGEGAVPVLAQLLGDQNPEICLNAVYCLGCIGPDARVVVPLLLPFLDGTNETLAWITTASLGDIHADPGSVVPRLICNLNTNIPIRYRAMTMRSLSRFGEDAQAAVPAIILFLNDPRADTREAATNALKTIDPRAAAKIGVK